MDSGRRAGTGSVIKPNRPVLISYPQLSSAIFGVRTESLSMREKDLHALEFDTVLQLLAEGAVSPAGREACAAIRPHTDPDRIVKDSERTWQFFWLLEQQLSLPLREFPDIRSSLQWAVHVGTALEGAKLREILGVIALSRQLSQFFRRHAESASLLADLPARLSTFPTLEDTLNRCLDDGGNLKDEASPHLRSLRRRVRTLQEEIERRLQHQLRSSQAKDVIADQYITIRNNRFVIPVRANFQSRLQGIVQDQSGSGETVFIEPLFAVELNNRLTLAHREVEAEEQRLLQWLTELVREELDAIKSVFATLTEVDVLNAKAVLAHKYRCSKPLFGGPAVQLRAARHPLLLATGKPVIPIDLHIPEGKLGLIVTGPNTGGKTAALKTLGLLCVMAQSGLLIPAQEESQLPFLRGVFCDIGDEQSLEQSLSTFSGHIKNVSEILAELVAPALLLFDEPGGGTDPIEGGALACGLLGYLQERGVYVAASTHLTPLKLFALADGAYQVAAVNFDVDTLTPQYALHYDTVGQSMGLAMARRLGLPQEVCAAAEASLSLEAKQLSEAMTKLEESRVRLEHERVQVADEWKQASAMRKKQQALLADAEEKRQRIWQDELSEAKSLVHNIREEGRVLVAKVRERTRAPQAERQKAQRALTQFVHEQRGAIATRENALRPASTDVFTPPKIGDQVEAKNGKIRGELVAVNGQRARIRSGGLTFDLALVQLSKTAKIKGEHLVHVAVRRPETVQPEINLLGLRVNEALPRLAEFLDQAMLNRQSSVRIVHGFGTGALRRAVQDFLSQSPYCASYNEAPQNEGGGGATIAELAG